MNTINWFNKVSKLLNKLKNKKKVDCELNTICNIEIKERED